LQINGAPLEAESYPDPLPDLYEGEPLVVYMKMDKEMEDLQVSGKIGFTPFQYGLDLARAKAGAGIAKLWAREKISQEMEGLSFGVPEEKVRTRVLQTALQFGLVSKYTSLVAVEEKRVRPSDQKLESTAIKGHLPHGSKSPLLPGEQLYAGGPKTGTSSYMLFALSFCMMVLSFLLYRFSQRFSRSQWS